MDSQGETVSSPDTQTQVSLQPHASDERKFWVFQWPRFRFVRDASAGFWIGFLTTGLCAGIAALYDLFTYGSWSSFSGGNQFFSSVFMLLFIVLATAALLLSAVVLPVLLVRGKGRRYGAKVFIAEFLVLLLAMSAAFYGLTQTNASPDNQPCGFSSTLDSQAICPQDTVQGL